MKSVVDEHIPGANVARAAWTGNGVWRGRLGTDSATLGVGIKPPGHDMDLGFITDSCSHSKGGEQRFWRSGLRRIALHDVRVKINDRLHQFDSGIVTACSAGGGVGNNAQRALDVPHTPHQGMFTPSMDLVSHESVQARRMPSDYLEAGHFGGGLKSLRSGSMMQTANHTRRPITHPAGNDAACADAKTQTVCEASAQIMGVRRGVQHANVQTEEDDPGPVRERVICIPSGARPTSCTPVIVPFKATRKGGKAVRKRTAKVKKARPDEGQRPASSTPARRQNRPTPARPVSAPLARKTAPEKKAGAGQKQTATNSKSRLDMHSPSGCRTRADTGPPAAASSPIRDLPPALDRPVLITCPEVGCPVSDPDLASDHLACSPRPQEERSAAVPVQCSEALQGSQHPLANTQPQDRGRLRQHFQTEVPACCHCSCAGALPAPDSSQAAQEQLPPREAAREAPQAIMPLHNPERQSMVSTLERAVADLERDVMARAARPPSDASGPSFANSLESLAALEAEITAQQRRLASVGVVARGGLHQMSSEAQPLHALPCPVTADCELRSGHQQRTAAALRNRDPQVICPLQEASMPTHAFTREPHSNGRHPPPGRYDLSSHVLMPEPSFSHTASSALQSGRHGTVAPVHDRDSSSSPDGNFSTVSIEDRLKRLGLSDQISQLIRDITADTESTSSPAQSAGENVAWRKVVGSVSDTASTVTLPSLAPPKPLDAVRGLRSSSASPLDEFASSRSNGDAAQVSPTLAGRMPYSHKSSSGRTPSPTDSSPSMHAPKPSASFPLPGSGTSPVSRSPSGRTDEWRGGPDSSHRSQGEGPFGDTSTARSMDDVLSDVMQGRSSWNGSDGGRSASLQLDDDRPSAGVVSGAGSFCTSTGGNIATSQQSPQHSSPGAPFSVRQADSDKSFMSPMASSDASMRADSASATPVDLRADVDSILCGSFWRS